MNKVCCMYNVVDRYRGVWPGEVHEHSVALGRGYLDNITTVRGSHKHILL